MKTLLVKALEYFGIRRTPINGHWEVPKTVLIEYCDGRYKVITNYKQGFQFRKYANGEYGAHSDDVYTYDDNRWIKCEDL